MNLIPFSKQHLRLNEALPFGVRDRSGRLLLGAGAVIGSEGQLGHLQAEDLYADETESSEWRKRLTAAVDHMIRQNATLKNIADARPDEAAASGSARLTFTEQWAELALGLDTVLRDASAAQSWLPRLASHRDRVRRLAGHRLDASLYHLIYTAGHSTQHYSSHHALLCMLIGAETARMLGWTEAQVDSIEQAALTMNVSMRRLQDLLAARDSALTAEMREAIKSHAANAAQLLVASGCTDKIWVEAVRLHHDDSLRERPFALLTPGQQAARLLRRVDIFTAKMSRRATRLPMSPVQAAREACLGQNRVPDEIGGALLKSVGLFPPGSFVELASGEVGIVIARGPRANQPEVAVLLNASGAPVGDPIVRHTGDARHAVKGAVPVNQVRVTPPHDRVLALR
ncbi:MAG: HD-GYP domain-containing protein [Aquabacterium sp.]